MRLLRGFQGSSASTLSQDVSSGLVVAALSIPISMGYAQVAGLSPAYGLFASMVAPLLYALLTRSHHIVFGMDSATSAALGSVLVAAHITFGSSAAVSYVTVVGLFAALFLVLFSLLRLGRLAQRVPTPVVHGFVAGISVSVIVGQVPLLVGSASVSGGSLISQLAACVRALSFVNVPSVVLSACALVVLYLCRRKVPRLPAPLVVLVIALACSVLFRWADQGMVMLGALPTALPRMRLPSFAGVDVARSLFGGFTVAVVSAIESLLTVNLFALRHDWLGGEDHELLSFGIVNAVVALCGCPTCSVSLSCSAAGEAAGGRTQLASVVASVTVVGAVLLFSPALAYLPQPALAAVVVDAMACVVDVRKIARYARRMHSEFLVFVLTALVVALLGAIVGVAFGIALSLALLWCRSHSTRHEKLMGVVSPETVLDGIEIPCDTMVYRFSGTLSFLNIAPLVASLVSAIESDTRVVIIDLSAVVELDTTSTDRLVSAIESLQARGLQVRVVRGLTPSRDHYTRFELEHIFHRAQVYPTVASAIAIVPQELQEVVQVEPEDLQDGASG